MTKPRSSRHQPVHQRNRDTVPTTALPMKTAGRVEKKKPNTNAPKSSEPKTECIICATERRWTQFVAPEDASVSCKHFRVTCKPCMSTMVKMMVADRRLDEASLKCPQPGCEMKLDFEQVKKIITKGVFKS